MRSSGVPGQWILKMASNERVATWALSPGIGRIQAVGFIPERG